MVSPYGFMRRICTLRMEYLTTTSYQLYFMWSVCRWQWLCRYCRIRTFIQWITMPMTVLVHGLSITKFTSRSEPGENILQLKVGDQWLNGQNVPSFVISNVNYSEIVHKCITHWVGYSTQLIVTCMTAMLSRADIVFIQIMSVCQYVCLSGPCKTRELQIRDWRKLLWICVNGKL